MTNLPAHYRIPLFAGLATAPCRRRRSLRVFFLAAGAAGRPWLRAPEELDFDHEFLKSIHVPVRRRRAAVPAIRPSPPPRRVRPDDRPRGRVLPVLDRGSRAVCPPAGRIPFGIWSGRDPVACTPGPSLGAPRGAAQLARRPGHFRNRLRITRCALSAVNRPGPSGGDRPQHLGCGRRRFEEAGGTRDASS